jgi:hypothetical protein
MEVEESSPTIKILDTPVDTQDKPQAFVYSTGWRKLLILFRF